MTSGPQNGNWKGGRSVASNGYVLVRVGKDHHLADVRGYAYEHRLNAELMLGRRLEPDEQVHHIDGDKANNATSNLMVHRIVNTSVGAVACALTRLKARGVVTNASGTWRLTGEGDA